MHIGTACRSRLALCVAAAFCFSRESGIAVELAALKHRGAASVASSGTPRDSRPGNVIPVANCADAGTGSFRAAASLARDGDTIDLTQLTCSLITLTTGSVWIASGTIKVRGPRSLVISQFGNESGLLLQMDPAHTSHLNIYGLRLVAGVNKNQLPGGGCITADGNVRLEGTSLSHCEAYFDGGGIWAGGSVELVESSVTQCLAEESDAAPALRLGGGIYAKRGLSMMASTVSYNAIRTSSQVGAVGYGGGAFTLGDTYIFYSTIAYNDAGYSFTQGSVGGLDVADGFQTSIFNSTIAGNSASWFIGGVFVASLHLSVVNSTISFNSAMHRGFASGLYIGVTQTNLLSSIISNNYSIDQNDFAGGGQVTGYGNLIMASAISPPGTLTADPMLRAMESNGGPTYTLALDANSPAIDRGNNIANAAHDQRGLSRMYGAAPDIGAYERQPPNAIFSNGFEPARRAILRPLSSALRVAEMGSASDPRAVLPR